MKILVLDEISTSTVGKGISYSDFYSTDEAQVVIITNHLSDQDKQQCLDFVEISTPSQNAKLELIACQLHKKYQFDKIYTKQEDLILRAAYLRQYLSIPGLQPQQALLFRNKYMMKQVLKEHIPVKPFALVQSPCDIIRFFDLYKKVVVKPVMGSASQGVFVISTKPELQHFLESVYFTCTKQMEYQNEWMVEEYIGGTMYHVNGILEKGELREVWAFQYLNTNFGFTQGTYYGNALVQPSDPIYDPLLGITKKILKVLPQIHVFHLELFHLDGVFYLCEIAARRPGGSIGLLIAALTEPAFPKIEFRCNNELPVECTVKEEWIGDVLIPKPIGVLKNFPNTIPFGELKVFGKVGDRYTGFDINHLNTLVRIIVKGDSLQDVKEKLEQSASIFLSNVEYE